MRQFKKRMLANGLALSLVLSSLPTTYASATEKNNVKFSDVKGHWAESFINDFTNKGYINGYGDGTFRPNNKVTRAEFVKIVNRTFGFTQKGNENFSDVNKDDWYYDEVLKAVKQGYINGYEDGTFKPNDEITREEACKIIGFILEVSGDGKTKFKDEKEISDWAIKYVDGLVDKGIIHGYEDNTFKPKNNATRAESVKTLYGAKDKYNSDDDILPPVMNPTPPVEPEVPVEPDNDLLNPDNPKWNMDSDKDGLKDAEEELIGTNPNKADTDGDGLNDKFELESGLDATKKDSDNNNILDSEEDLDTDGLKNIDEQKYNTSPIFEDTDGDGLNDYEEINKYKTNPLEEDTDKDGIIDGKEIELGTDPTKKDSNGNGINDGDEKYEVNIETPKSDKDQNVDVNITGNITGENIHNLYIINMEGTHEFINSDIPGYISAPFRVGNDNGNSTENVNITFTLNEEVVKNNAGDEFALYKYNKEKQLLEIVTESQKIVYKKGKTFEFAAENVELGKEYIEYILLNKTKWDEAWSKEMIDPGNESGLLDIVLTIDSSGSMDWNDPSDLRKQESIDFINKLEGENRAAVVDFDSSAILRQGLTTDKALLQSAINKIDSSGGTNISKGLRKAIDELDPSNKLKANVDYDKYTTYEGEEENQKNNNLEKIKNIDYIENISTVEDISKEIDSSSRNKFIMLLTDGESTIDSRLTEEAKAKNIKVYTIGLGSGIDSKALENLSTETGGKYQYGETAEDFEEIFKELEDGTINLIQDTDGDGIPDYFEENMRLVGGIFIKLDPKNKDTDGDGLSDGFEITGKDNPTAQDFHNSYNKDKIAFTYISRPDLKDTDNDGTLDGNGEDISNGNIGSSGNVVDKNPTIYDVSDRMLLESADLSYIKSKIKVDTKVSDINYTLYTDLTTKNAGIKDFTVIDQDKPGGFLFQGKGFGAIALINGDKLIVSFTGSQDEIDWLNNFTMLLLLPHYQQNLGVTFIRNILNNNTGIKEVYISGHSLGGLITQYTIDKFVRSNVDKEYDKFRAVTFNSATFVHPNHVNDVPSAPLLDISNNNQGIISDKDKYWSKVDDGVLSSKIKHHVITNDFINYSLGARYLGNKPIAYDLGYVAPPGQLLKAHDRDNFYKVTLK